MKKRILAGILLVIVLGLLMARLAGPREPVYEGRPLSEWLAGHVPNSSADPPYNSPGWHKADEALRSIGTNAIPTLVEMIGAKDPPPVILRLLEKARRYRWLEIDYRPASTRNYEAAYAFELLGPEAVTAVPGLIEIYEADVSTDSQMNAALSLGHIGQEAEAAIPALLKNFTHPDERVRFYAVSAVMSIRSDPAVTVPALVSMLNDPYKATRWNATSGLSRFGSRARAAVPDLLDALEDTELLGDEDIRQQLETTLWRIAPEKISRPIIIEAATPVIENGLTTHALDIEFNGERRTLIQAGMTVPVVGQLWSHSVGAPMSVYLRMNSSEESGQFLGRFEIVGEPDSDGIINCTVLVVVDVGKIFLCARDRVANHGEFLEVRRLE